MFLGIPAFRSNTHLKRSLEGRRRAIKHSPNRGKLRNAVRLLNLLGIIQQCGLKSALLEEAQLDIGLGCLDDIAGSTVPEALRITLLGKLESPRRNIRPIELAVIQKSRANSPIAKSAVVLQQPDYED